MPYDPITLLSTLSTIALPPDTQDSLSVSWLDSYRMGFPPMKHYTLCWAHTDRLPVMAVPRMDILSKKSDATIGFPTFSSCHPVKTTVSYDTTERRDWIGKRFCIVPIDGCPHAQRHKQHCERCRGIPGDSPQSPQTA